MGDTSAIEDIADKLETKASLYSEKREGTLLAEELK